MLLNLLQPKAVKRLAFRASESVLPQLPDRCSSRRPDQTAEITLHFSLHMPSHCSDWNDTAVERSVNRDSGSGWVHLSPRLPWSQDVTSKARSGGTAKKNNLLSAIATQLQPVGKLGQNLFSVCTLRKRRTIHEADVWPCGRSLEAKGHTFRRAALCSSVTCRPQLHENDAKSSPVYLDPSWPRWWGWCSGCDLISGNFTRTNGKCGEDEKCQVWAALHSFAWPF